MKKTLLPLVAGIALFGFSGFVQARPAATAADGITASPKHREQLDFGKPAGTNPRRMDCADCKDQVVTKTDWTARGMNKPQVRIVKHLCEGCDTRVITTGQGKAAKTRVEHSCGTDLKAACCKAG